MKKISFFLLISILFISCEQESDDLTVFLNQSGTLDLTVTNNNQEISGAKVSIYSYEARIYFDSTDANGTCNAGALLQGQYQYEVKAEKNGRTYSEDNYFQIIAGDHKVLSVDPFLNAGDAKIRIVTSYYSDPIPNINVALIPESYSGEYDSYETLMNKAYDIKQTDEDGWVRFQNMPAGRVYRTLIFINSGSYDYPYSSFYINRDSEKVITIETSII